MLVQKSRDAAVLAGIELVEAIHREHEIAFGNLEPGFKLTGVFQLVDIDLDRSATGFTLAASLPRWSKPGASFSPPTM